MLWNADPSPHPHPSPGFPTGTNEDAHSSRSKVGESEARTYSLPSRVDSQGCFAARKPPLRMDREPSYGAVPVGIPSSGYAGSIPPVQFLDAGQGRHGDFDRQPSDRTPERRPPRFLHTRSTSFVLKPAIVVAAGHPLLAFSRGWRPSR